MAGAHAGPLRAAKTRAAKTRAAKTRAVGACFARFRAGRGGAGAKTGAGRIRVGIGT
jgi:hypothetical protein